MESAAEESDVPALVVHERVTVLLDSESYVTLQWSSDPISDMVSDSVVAMILNIGREGPKVVPVEEAAKTKEETEKVAQKVVYALMASLFSDVKVAEEGKFVITVDGNVVQLDGWSGDVECENASGSRLHSVAYRVR